MTSPKSTQKKCPISICLSEVFPVSHSAWQENGADLRTQEVLSSIISPELSSISDLQLFSLKMFPVCYRMVRGKLTSRSSASFRNWGIVLNGLCITAQASESRNPVSECTLSDILEQICAGDIAYLWKIFPVECLAAKNPKRLIDGPQGSRVYSTDGTAVTQCAGSGGGGGKTGLYIDLNADPELTELARCILARYDAGVSNHRGSASGVLVEEQPCAVLCPEKENPRQNGRRMKNPNEPMFTITVTDRHGVVHKGRVRKLMPIECWRLQGFTDKQFRAASSVIKSDGHLYKMAGNAVTVNVIEAIGRKIKAVLFDGGVE